MKERCRLKNNNSGFLLVFSLSIITLIFGIGLSNNFVSATSTSATVKVSMACSLSVSGGGYYSAIVPNGTMSEIEGSTLTATCNDTNGFAIYAVGYSDDTIGNTNMVNSSGGSNNIATNTSGNNSYWAMKVNPVTGNTPTIDNSFSNYHIVPNSHTKVASYSSSAPGGLSVKATYKVNISATELAGTYLGKVKYTLVHPSNEVPPHDVACEANRICYNANTAIIEGQMGKQTPTSSQITNGIPLWAPNFKRDGYGFAGWSDKYDYETNPDAHFYGPHETITAPSDISTNGLSLYAIWIPSAGSMQDSSTIASVCSGLTKAPTDGTANLSSVSALTDTRDGDTYAIAKLADGKCWTIENLRLDDSAELSSTNTHSPSLPLTNIYDSSTTSNRLSPTSSLAYDATTAPEGWCTTNSAACYNQSRLRTDNTTLFTDNTSSSYNTESNVYSYGNYYNWYSATAGHGTYSKTSGNTSGDICPAGWHLPTGGSASAEFGALDVDMGGTGNYQSTTEASNRWRTYPNNFVYSGLVSVSSVSNRNSYGYYWSSSAGTSYYRAQGLQLGSSDVYPGSSSGSGKYLGLMVRCIADV